MRRKVAALAALGLALAATVSWSGPLQAQLAPPPRGTPAAPTTAPRPTATFIPGDQRLQALQQIRPGGRVYDIATETRGKPITIGGKTVQLPADAYVEAVITDGLCPAGKTCPETPAYVIVRGKSRLAVSVRSGQINAETLAPGEEGAFAFLREALR